ncbi:unnamed protein product [Ilex paraguariensis]|uniref:Phytocyanin domain-containing protein n=1 Tax=Ilex paraguariensis TaxID=185542 RepID=A0ABC8REU7_9AQUA
MEGVFKFYLVFVFATLLLMNKEAMAATQHVVGGSQGWDQSTDFTTWASGQTFKPGDQLVFKYTALHSVVELPNESAYKNCNMGNALNSLNGGNNVVKIDKPGTRYFTCGTLGHCAQGMKVKITTVSADASSSTPGSSSSSSTTPTPTSTSISMASSFSHFASILMVALPVFHVIFIML